MKPSLGGGSENVSTYSDDVKLENETHPSTKPATLVMCGGEGYVDFRVGSNNNGQYRIRTPMLLNWQPASVTVCLSSARHVILK